ncbi:hypothetical protein AGMMS50218_05850 [Actinomycetota bacterium]|nr:hypothetical protein AGMMS50218_05850 [Actinomycetota bacterium]
MGREMQAVELVDVHTSRWSESPAGGPGPDGPPGLWRALVGGVARAGRTLWRHRDRWPLLAGAVVVLAVVWTGVRVVQWRHEQAYLATLVGLPDVVAPIDGGAQVRWTAQVDELGQVPSWLQAGDLLIGTGLGATGPHIVALQADTGEVSWRWPRDEDGSGGAPGMPWCIAASGAALLCWSGASEGEDTEDLGDDRRTLLVLDAVTGADLRAPVEVRGHAQLVAVGADAVLVRTERDGSVEVVRYDVATWSPRWSRTLPARLAGGDAAAQVDGWPSVLVEGERVAVEAAAVGVVLLDAADGAVTTTVAPAGGTQWLVQGADGTGFAVRFDDGAALETSTLDGSFTRPGYWVPPPMDDGSLGTVLVDLDMLGNPAVPSLDVARVGAAGWSADGVGMVRNAAVLDHRLLALTEDELTVFDGEDGDRLWTVPVEAPTVGLEGTAQLSTQVLTDGREVLVVPGPTGRGDDGPVLQAYSLADGRPTWRIDLPDDAAQVSGVGGRLLVQTSGGRLVHLG